METLTKYDVKEMTWTEKVFLTKRNKVAFDKLSTFFGEAYAAIYEAVKNQGLSAQGMPFAFYYDIDEANKETDVAAAVAIIGQVPEVKGFKKVIIPASKVLTTTHYGSYESVGPAYEELEKYRRAHSLKKLLMIEEYFSDPTVESDPSKWKTNIYIIVK